MNRSTFVLFSKIRDYDRTRIDYSSIDFGHVKGRYTETDDNT